MLKQKISRKGLHDIPGSIVLSCDYCTMQTLLINHPAEYYNFGVYGWNWDAYRVGRFVICTGYRNTTGRRISSADIREYERQADNALRYLPYEKAYDAIEKLLNELLNKYAA